MLFNSYVFILVFLPLALLIYHGIRVCHGARPAIFALMSLSFGFYGWWNPIYLLLLIPMMLVNYILATKIIPVNGQHPPFAKSLFLLGLTMNLSVLGYFKYSNFFVENVNLIFGLDMQVVRVILPLGISFFTFQKIGFLVDSYRGKVGRLNLLDFSLFVSFFPQLIAGPIVHHSEFLPQIERAKPISSSDTARGLTFFICGLTKKVILADTIAPFATEKFSAVAAGAKLSLLAAWTGVLAYSAQLYFDFSGYCDMAIGAALLFGIYLPVNFNSPYKATSIIHFWRRWHITLSRFLRDYLYIPLGGNRAGLACQYANVFVTMLLGGLWHGASWNFVIWGGLHGIYLIINHSWRQFFPKSANPIGIFSGWLLTFLSVIFAWVFFRAETITDALSIIRSMMGRNDLAQSADDFTGFIVALLSLGIAWLAPNTQECLRYAGVKHLSVSLPPYGERSRFLEWKPTWYWATLYGCLFALSLGSLSKITEFLYFQF